MLFFQAMTDKQAVLNALNRLPETVTFSEIAEEVRIMSSVKLGREDILAGRSKSQQEVSELVESWAAEWTTR